MIKSMNSLFHYTSAESLIKIIESQSIKFSTFTDVNDKNECEPVIRRKEEYCPKEYEDLVDQHIKLNTGFIKAGRKAWKKSKSSEDFRTYCLNYSFPEDINYQQIASNHFRFISFCKKPDIESMWQSYGRNHSGGMIEFSLDESPFVDMIKTNILFSVNYTDEPIVYDHIRNELKEHNEKISHKSIFFKIASTKTKRWSNEEEIRSILPHRRCLEDEKLKNIIYSQNNDVFLKLKPQAFKAIDFGKNINKNIKEKIEKIINFHSI